jgi:hypothetical protein
MNSKWHSSEKLVGELGDKLFRELVWSIDIVASGDEDGKFEGTKVGFDQKLSSSFGGSIGVGGLKDMILHHRICLEVFSLSINFIGRNVNESLDRGAALGRLEKHVRSVNV